MTAETTSNAATAGEHSDFVLLTESYSNITVQKEQLRELGGSQPCPLQAGVRLQQERIPVEGKDYILLSKGREQKVIYGRFIRQMKASEIITDQFAQLTDGAVFLIDQGRIGSFKVRDRQVVQI